MMRQFVTATAIATGLVGFWAAIVPLTAQPAPKPTNVSSPALSKALFLCRGPNGIDRACTAALARALVTEQQPRRTATPTEERSCRAGPSTMSASINPRD